MQLKAIILQKPSEEWVDWKSDASYQIGDVAHSLPPGRIGGVLRLSHIIEGDQLCSDRDQIRGRKKSLRLQLC